MHIHRYRFHLEFSIRMADFATPYADWGNTVFQLQATLDDAALTYIAGGEL